MNESNIQKYESDNGLMKPSGVGQYVKLTDYRTLEMKLEKANKIISDCVSVLEKAKSEITPDWAPAITVNEGLETIKAKRESLTP